jgi:putative endonuclease
MAAEAFDLGRRGETLAVDHLRSRGWTVLDRNWRDGPRELDIVAFRPGVLAFVEVKTRSPSPWGHPLDAVTPAKRRELERAARAWLERAGGARVTPRTDGAPPMIRFDAVVVQLGPNGTPEIQHVPDAWRPGWGG